ncbi:hypothetical protein NC651_016227 [Populus alba x Populus x berolinensis]|nr:hypothetical protein NC651_016227 [Populus alba x Populus x berolinensis]
MGSAQERFRLLVSDSVLTQHAMLGTQLNDRVKPGVVRKGSVIQLIDYICSQVQKRQPDYCRAQPGNYNTRLKLLEILKMVHDATAHKSFANTNSVKSVGLAYYNPTSQSHANMKSFRPTLSTQIVKNEAPARIIHVNALNPYQERWAIKARVTAKGDLRRYKVMGRSFTLTFLILREAKYE